MRVITQSKKKNKPKKMRINIIAVFSIDLKGEATGESSFSENLFVSSFIS